MINLVITQKLAVVHVILILMTYAERQNFSSFFWFHTNVHTNASQLAHKLTKIETNYNHTDNNYNHTDTNYAHSDLIKHNLI